MLQYAKAIAAFVAAGLVPLGAALLEGSPGGSAVTGYEWTVVLGTALATTGVVYRVPNRSA